MQNIFTQVQFEWTLKWILLLFPHGGSFPYFFVCLSKDYDGKKGTFPQVERNKRSGLDGEKYLLNVNNKNNRMWVEMGYQSVSTYTTVSTNVSSMNADIENARGKALKTYTRSTLASLCVRRIYLILFVNFSFFFFLLFDTQNSPDYR